MSRRLRAAYCIDFSGSPEQARAVEALRLGRLFEAAHLPGYYTLYLNDAADHEAALQALKACGAAISYHPDREVSIFDSGQIAALVSLGPRQGSARAICPTCHGLGTCPYCEGVNYSEDNTPLCWCGDSGKCPQCRGRGTIPPGSGDARV